MAAGRRGRAPAVTVVAAACLAALAAATPAAATPAAVAGPGTAAAPAAVTDPAVRAVRATPDDRVTLVAAAGAVPARPPAVSVTAGGTTLPVQVNPVWSDTTAVGLVLEVPDQPDAAGRDGGLAGAAGFLLQLPPGARHGIVVDRRPPVLAAPPGTGAADALAALSELAGGGGERDTSAALTLALRRVPARAGDRSVIILYTSAARAGGETAAALGERFRSAGAVLAVVSTNPDARYWRAAADATGGVAVATDAADAIAAFDRVADALRARFVVGFPRPPVTSAGLRWTTSGTPVVVPVAIPPEPPPAARPAAPWREVPVLTGAGLAAAVALACGLLLALRGLRRRASARAADELVPSVPAGVRVFDVAAEAPREITGSLFEPRSVRDAREREARARAARQRHERDRNDPFA